jgi:hypothetical protein
MGYTGADDGLDRRPHLRAYKRPLAIAKCAVSIRSPRFVPMRKAKEASQDAHRSV